MKRNKTFLFTLCALLVITLTAAVLWMILVRLTGAAFFGKTGYCTYTLQAMAWRNGSLSLGQDYPWLELAVYRDDWYVSFPPVPTVPVWLLTFIFGSDVPDNLLVKLYALIGMLAVYGALRTSPSPAKRRDAVFTALMTGFCGSAMALSTEGAVWYQAQIMAFMLMMLAICLTVKGKITPALFCYALSVGCRPFDVSYGPLLMLIGCRKREVRTLTDAARNLWKGVALGLTVAAAYAVYNYVRFGNPLEFGTNYLPEFMRSAHGQFSLTHIWGNIKNVVLSWPWSVTENGWELKQFGFSLFLANPLLICLPVRAGYDLIRHRMTPEKTLCLVLFAAHLFLLLLHRTFGGYQFGARYAVDLIPYYVIWRTLDKRRLRVWEIIAGLIGVVFALYGVALIHI